MFFWDQHKTITSCYEKVTGSVCEKYQLTHMEYDILMFLHNNPHHNTAAEIVKVRKSTKSHVSSSLKNLESRGLIERIQSADNEKPDDPKDLCIYVDHCNGTSASVLGQQALSNRLTMDQTLDVRSVFWYVCGHLFLR